MNGRVWFSPNHGLKSECVETVSKQSRTGLKVSFSSGMLSFKTR